MQIKNNVIRYICLFVLLGTVLLSLGVTFARYKTSIANTIVFETEEIGQDEKVFITTSEGWEKASNSLGLKFTLSGGKNVGEDAVANIRMTATELFNPNATVSLTVDGVTYWAKAFDVSDDNLLYSQMGNGTEFRFYSDGEEIYWPISQNKNMTLYIQGASDESLIRLVAKQK